VKPQLHWIRKTGKEGREEFEFFADEVHNSLLWFYEIFISGSKFVQVYIHIVIAAY
jgi:hypothetical protein